MPIATPKHWSRWGALLLLSVGSHPAKAEPTAARAGHAVEWSAPTGCPSQADFEATVAELETSKGTAPRSLGVVISQDVERWVLHLRVVTSDGVGQRVLQGHDCAELVRAAAAIVALASTDAPPTTVPPADAPPETVTAEPGAASNAASWSAPQDTPSGAGPPPTAPSPRPEAGPRPPRRSPRGHPRPSKPGAEREPPTPANGKAPADTSPSELPAPRSLELTTAANGLFGEFPGTVLEANVALHGNFGPWRSGVRAGLTPVIELGAASHSVRLQRVAVGADAAYLWAATAGVRVGPLAFVELTRIGGDGLPEPSWSFAAGLGVAAPWRLGGGWLLLPSAAAVVAPQSTVRTTEATIQRTAWTRPLFGARVGLGVGYAF